MMVLSETTSEGRGGRRRAASGGVVGDWQRLHEAQTMKKRLCELSFENWRSHASASVPCSSIGTATGNSRKPICIGCHISEKSGILSELSLDALTGSKLIPGGL